VQDDQIPRTHLLQQGVGAAAQRRLVDGALGSAQRASIAGAPVKAIVKPLGHFEEARVAADRHPAGVHSRSAGVADERAQHLGDPAATRGGVHIPNDPVGQHAAGPRERILDAPPSRRRQHIAKALQ